MISKMLMLFSVLLLIPFLLVATALIRNDLPWTSPPGFFVRLTYYLGNNDVKTSEDSLYPELRPQTYAQEDMLLFATAKDVVNQLEWEIVQEDSEALTLHAVVTTPLFKFKDDVFITISKVSNGNVVNVYSRSRVGKGDLGTNTRHIIDFYSRLNQTVSTLENNQTL